MATITWRSGFCAHSRLCHYCPGQGPTKGGTIACACDCHIEAPPADYPTPNEQLDRG